MITSDKVAGNIALPWLLFPTVWFIYLFIHSLIDMLIQKHIGATCSSWTMGRAWILVLVFIPVLRFVRGTVQVYTIQFL